MRTVVIVSAIVMLSACGGDGDGAGPSLPSELEQRCQGQCSIEGDPECGEEDRSECLTNCRRRLSGVATLCGACMVDEGSSLFGDSFDGSCRGGQVASIASSDCEGFCQVEHPGNGGVVANHCEASCEIAGDPECTETDREQCLTRCSQNTAGLPFACAVCLIHEGSSLFGDSFDGSCRGGNTASLSSEECAPYCVPE